MDKEIYLAGGCFWGVDAYMNLLDGVIKTTSGYAQGHKSNPTYEEVCQNNTGHAECVKVIYDTEIISLKEILLEYFKIIDPTTLDRQANDIGNQYRTGVYYNDINDLAVIKEVFKHEQKKYQKLIVVEKAPLTCFYEAEEYHQKYLDKHPNGYCHINLNNAKAFNKQRK